MILYTTLDKTAELIKVYFSEFRYGGESFQIFLYNVGENEFSKPNNIKKLAFTVKKREGPEPTQYS